MHVPQLNIKELKPWLNKTEMIEACAAQTIKDLGMYGIELQFSGNAKTAYEELFQQLKPHIEERVKFGSIQEILYRVDVSEKQLNEMLVTNTDLASGITTLILWRELQKVVTRYLVSSSTSPPKGSDEGLF